MSKKPQPKQPAKPARNLGNHYIRQWREYRGLSLKRTIERMEEEPGGKPIITDMSLSRIERGTQPYSEEVLAALSHALDAEPWELLSVNPQHDAQIIDFLRYARKIAESSGDRALQMLRAAFG